MNQQTAMNISMFAGIIWMMLASFIVIVGVVLKREDLDSVNMCILFSIASFVAYIAFSIPR